MISLFRHQQVALNYLRLNNGFMLLMEQGCGKTIPTLCRLLELIEQRKIVKGLIVCPKSVMASWKRDIEKFSNKQQILLNKYLTIINYDKVWRGDVYDKQWDVIVLDEAHCIKNRASKRASFLLKLSVRATYRYLLTGTPVSNGRLEDWWSLLTFISPKVVRGKVNSQIFADHDSNNGSYTEWTKKYALLDQYFKPYRYKFVDEIQKIVKRYSFRVLKEQCLDLPEKLPDEIISIELAPKTRKLYNDLARKSASLELEYVAENPLTRMLKLRQLCSGYFQDGDRFFKYDNEKLSALKEFLDAYGDKKLVIFAEFKKSMEDISKLLSRFNIKHITLNGEQKDKEIWRRFQSDPSVKVIIVQYASGCQGIDLFASDTILYYECCIRSTQFSQSKDRIHRIGQKTKCSYYHFITKNSIEESIYKALQGYIDFDEKMFTKYIEEYQRSRR